MPIYPSPLPWSIPGPTTRIDKLKELAEQIIYYAEALIHANYEPHSPVVRRIIDQAKDALATAETQGVNIEEIKRIELKPGEVLVLRSPRRLSKMEIENLRERMARVFPGHRAMLLEEGLFLEIISLQTDSPILIDGKE